ncbi:MAG: hypothetical protein NVS9B11_18290 [Candidatus Dormibacteraceae bacterium]
MIRLPFGLGIVNARMFDAMVDHVARLLTERCVLIVERDAHHAIIAAQNAELGVLRAAMADADRLLGLGE